MEWDKLEVLGVGAKTQGHQKVLEQASALTERIYELTQTVHALALAGDLTPESETYVLATIAGLVRQQVQLVETLQGHATALPLDDQAGQTQHNQPVVSDDSN